MKNWSIEREICNLTGKRSVSEALVYLGLLPKNRRSFELIVEDQWYRSGAETYLFRFKIRSDTKKALIKKIVLKACVAYSGGSDVNMILGKWIERRELLTKLGVKTPRLYAYGNGLIMEEYVPYEFTEELRDNVDRWKLLSDELVLFASTLVKLRFCAISPFSDLRTFGADLIAIDFGADLGEPNACNDSSSQILQELNKYLLYNGISNSSYIESMFLKMVTSQRKQ